VTYVWALWDYAQYKWRHINRLPFLFHSLYLLASITLLYISSPVSTEIRNRSRVGHTASVCNQPPRPTQHPTLSKTRNECRPKCDDTVRLGSKGGYLANSEKKLFKKFRLDTRKFVLSNRVVDKWNSLSAQCVNSCNINTF